MFSQRIWHWDDDNIVTFTHHIPCRRCSFTFILLHYVLVPLLRHYELAWVFSFCWRKDSDSRGHFGNCVWLQLVWWTMKYIFKEPYRLLCGELQLGLSWGETTQCWTIIAKQHMLIAEIFWLSHHRTSVSRGGEMSYFRVVSPSFKEKDDPLFEL